MKEIARKKILKSYKNLLINLGLWQVPQNSDTLSTGLNIKNVKV